MDAMDSWHLTAFLSVARSFVFDEAAGLFNRHTDGTHALTIVWKQSVRSI